MARLPIGAEARKGRPGGEVEALRDALEARGDLVAGRAGDPALFDAKLEEAVKAFQRRHGLEPDGIVGSATAAALNVSAADRLKQILANLERWRWIPRDLGEKFILINIADFRVERLRNGSEVLSMPAIVGTAYRRTPEFSGKMTYIEINPTWTIPPRLIWEDIMPKDRKDPFYLVDNGIRVFQGMGKARRRSIPIRSIGPATAPKTCPSCFARTPAP